MEDVNVTIDAQGLAKAITAKVEVTIIQGWLFRLRRAVGVQIMKLGAYVVGTKINLSFEPDEIKWRK